MTRTSKILLTTVGLAVLLALVAAIAFHGLSRDSDPPDESNLTVTWDDVPDAENGFIAMVAAGERVEMPEQEDLREKTGELLSEDHWNSELAAMLLAWNREALAGFDEACAKPRFQFPHRRYDDPAVKLGPSRGLVRLARLRARLALARGRPEDALRDGRALVRFGHRFQHGRGSLIQFLLGGLLKEMGIVTLEDVLGEGLPPDLLREAARETLPAADDADGLADAARIEYRMLADLVDDVAEGRLTKRDLGFEPPSPRDTASGYVFQPNRTKRWMAADYLWLVENAGRPWAEVPPFELAVHPDEAPSLATRNLVGRMLYARAAVSCEGLLEEVVADRAQARATALLLALDAEETETGRLPESLEALTPEPFDAVPLDPFDAAPLRWDRSRRTLWSTGPDLTDEGGNPETDLVYPLP